MKHVLCSDASWMYGNCAVPKQKLDL